MTIATKFRAIDADAHVVESERTWDYMDPEDVKYRPQLFSCPDNAQDRYWVIDGRLAGLRLPTLTEQELKVISDRAGRNLITPDEASHLDDVDLRLSHMDRLGVDIQVLHNTLWILDVTQRPEIDKALSKSWNRWMGEAWKRSHGRLRWSAVLPLTDIDEAINMMPWAKENGAVGVVMKPFEGSKFMLDPYFFPYLEAAQEHDLTITVHIANANQSYVDAINSPYDPSGGLPTFRMPTIHACNGLILSDIPKRFPSLRWGFIESSCQWIPWIMHETSRRAKQSGWKLPDNPFDEYNIYVSAQTDDDFNYVFSYIGDENIVIGTDYGHTDTSSEVDAIEIFRSLESVSDASKRKVLFDNAMDLYHF
jgi:predicted TIM-barrel fold metal-dependent hydrolase